MIEPRVAALVAAIVLLPGLGYMAMNGLLASPLAWLAFLGLGGGLVIVWVGIMADDQAMKTVLTWVGAGLMLAGFLASIIMDT